MNQKGIFNAMAGWKQAMTDKLRHGKAGQLTTRVLSFMTLLTMVAALAACHEEEQQVEEPKPEQKPLTFVVEGEAPAWDETRTADFGMIRQDTLVSDSGQVMVMTCRETAGIDRGSDSVPAMLTRAVLPTALTSFGVSASVYASGASYGSAPCGNYFFNQQFAPGTETGWFWPNSGRISFYAYWPEGTANPSVLSAATTNGAPTYYYAVPASVSEQQDFMTTQVTDVDGGRGGAVALAFHHALTALRFSLTNNTTKALTVTKVIVSGIYDKGRLSSGVTLSRGSWNNLTGNASSSFVIDMAVPVAKGATEVLNNGTTLLLAIPQSIPAGAKLQVVTSVGTFETALEGMWNPGKTNDYHLAKPADYAFELATGETEYTMNSRGGSFSATVTSSVDGDFAAFSAASSADWLTVTQSGTGTTRTVTFNASANNTGGQRTATVTLTQPGSGKTLTFAFTQAAPVFSFNIKSGSAAYSIEKTAQSRTLVITSTVDGEPQPFTIASTDGWLTATQTGTGKDKTVTLNATANVSASQRRGTLTLTQEGSSDMLTVSVTQACPDYRFSASTSTLLLVKEGESKNVDVTSTVDGNACAWSVSWEGDHSWLTLTNYGNGTQSMAVTASQNNGTPRSATMTLTQNNSGKSVQVTVRQDGLDYVFDVDRTSVETTAAATSNLRFNLTSSLGGSFVDYTVTQVSNPGSFCSFSKAGSRVTFSVTANTDKQNGRTATFRLVQNSSEKELLLTITQEQDKPYRITITEDLSYSSMTAASFKSTYSYSQNVNDEQYVITSDWPYEGLHRTTSQVLNTQTDPAVSTNHYCVTTGQYDDGHMIWYQNMRLFVDEVEIQWMHGGASEKAYLTAFSYFDGSWNEHRYTATAPSYAWNGRLIENIAVELGGTAGNSFVTATDILTNESDTYMWRSANIWRNVNEISIKMKNSGEEFSYYNYDNGTNPKNSVMLDWEVDYIYRVGQP